MLSDVVKAAELEGALFGLENLRESRRSHSIEEHHVAGTQEVMGRILKHSGLLLMALVLLAPVAVAFLWRSCTAGFLPVLLWGTYGGLAMWLSITLSDRQAQIPQLLNA